MALSAHRRPALGALHGRRLKVALVCGLAVWLAIVARLTMVQVVCGARLASDARDQGVIEVRLAPERGTVYDRNMVALTSNLAVQSVCAYPNTIEDPDPIARGLESALGGTHRGYLDKLTSGKSFAWIERQVEPSRAAALSAMRLPGVGFLKESKRIYPYGKSVCHIVGMTDVDGVGIAGIERAVDELLTGSEEWVCCYLGRDGRLSPSASFVRMEPHDGMSVVLTIDIELQGIAEVELERAVREHNAKGGSVIIEDPRTGELLAVANWPAFDPNHLERYSVESRRNRAITDQFEPGSTFKLITAASALATGSAELTSVYYAERGEKWFGRFAIHDVHEHGWLDFTRAFAKSSNVCLAQIAASVGEQALFDYATNFGFGCLTGVALPGEVRGTLREPQDWSRRSIHSVGIGQEVAVTALQLAGAYSAIANGGYLMEPNIVKAVIANDGRVVRLAEPSPVRRAVDPAVAATMRRLLREAAERGTGTKALVSGVSVGGKTGTAQKAIPGQRGYALGKHVSSFAGMVPAESPRFVCLVVIDEPDGRGLGGAVAAPVFSRIVERILRGSTCDLLVVSGSPRERPESPIEGWGERPEMQGGGHLAEAVPAARGDGHRSGFVPALLTGNRVAGRSGAGSEPAPRILVPDLRGMSIRAARREASACGLIVGVEGSGRVRTQCPRPGARAKSGERMILQCRPG